MPQKTEDRKEGAGIPESRNIYVTNQGQTRAAVQQTKQSYYLSIEDALVSTDATQDVRIQHRAVPFRVILRVSSEPFDLWSRVEYEREAGMASKYPLIKKNNR